MERAPVPGSESTHKLKAGAVGLVGVLFMAVANAAPITAMTGNTPIAIGYGNGIGAPAGFLVATIVLTLFTIGFVAMARHITTAGAFYGFITHGLGQVWGMATGALATMAYVVFEGSLIGIFSYFTNDALEPLARTSTSTGCSSPSSASRSSAAFGYFDINIAAGVPGRHPDLRGRPARRARLLGAVHRRRPDGLRARGGQPGQRLQGPAGGRRRRRLDRRHDDRGRQRGHRHVLRVLVVGRLRDHRGLRRGVAQPAAHRPPRDPDRRRRPRPLLHLRVLDDDRRQRRGARRSRRPTPTPSACGSTWPRTSSAARSSATSTCS